MTRSPCGGRGTRRTGDPEHSQGSCSIEDGLCTGIQGGSFNQGITIDILTINELKATEDFVCVHLTVEVRGTVRHGETAEVQLAFADNVGTPAIATVIVPCSCSIAPAVQLPATITLTERIPFVRGDVNGDDSVNMADVVWNLKELFTNGPETPCEDAADVDGDGVRTIGDSIYLLHYLFRNDMVPAPPFPGCGLDSGGDGLGCVDYGSCQEPQL